MASNNVSTYAKGFKLKTVFHITKGDLVRLCNLLNEKYSGECQFEPEPICEGGVVFKFPNPDWYKSLRLGIKNYPWVSENVMSEWADSAEILLWSMDEIDTYLKAFNGAPAFTIDELKVWEECFKEIGLVRIGRYPPKRNGIK